MEGVSEFPLREFVVEGEGVIEKLKQPLSTNKSMVINNTNQRAKIRTDLFLVKMEPEIKI